MDTQVGMPLPRLFTPHPNLGDAVNHNFIASEVEGGVFLDQLPPGAVLCVETRNRSYTLVNRGNGKALISGHPTFCPEPVLVHIEGSNWGGSMLKAAFIGRGMHLEFRHPEHRTIMTSCIVDVRAA
jgi:hypothetical protein